MLCTLSGIINVEGNDTHPQNDDSPMLCTRLGMVIDVNEIQLLNARLPILVSRLLLPKFTLVIDSHNSNE